MPHDIRPNTMDDPALIDRCRRGDPRAWEQLVDRYGALVFSIPTRVGLQQATCEDIFQDVFTILARQLPGIHNPRALPKWFTTTTHRVMRDTLRKTRLTAGDQLLANIPAAEVEAARWDHQRVIRQALPKIGERCRALLLALYRDDPPPSYEQIANILDIPIGSIGPTRARCLDTLAAAIEALEKSPEKSPDEA